MKRSELKSLIKEAIEELDTKKIDKGHYFVDSLDGDDFEGQDWTGYFGVFYDGNYLNVKDGHCFYYSDDRKDCERKAKEKNDYLNKL